jgi:aspartyl-tRNA(Asn)/glutamyl-tRNA(Gln) amidotransferase subunit A
MSALTPSGPPHTWDTMQIASRVRGGSISAEDVVRDHLAQIEAHAELNAFVTVDGDHALAEARHRQATGRLDGPLAGVPFAPKDLLDTAGLRTTYGSKHHDEHVPTRTAASVQRLVDAGAIIVGKANLHEYAWGITSQNPWHGRVQNPRHPGRIPGGSSGGSAVAVATGMAAVSLGTDTGGSIRIPAAACGIAGYKGRWGDVPTDGCYPLVPEMDHVGPMARSMAECALLMGILTGLEAPAPRLAGLRVGLLHPIDDGQRLEDAGAHVEEAELPPCDEVLRYFAAIAAATHRDRLASEPEGYSVDLRAKLEGGMRVTAADFINYGQAVARWRRRCGEELPFDLLVCPTIPSELPSADEPETNELRLRVTRYTRPFNALGWPSATTRDGTMFSGQSDAIVLGAALAWEEGLPPVALAGA